MSVTDLGKLVVFDCLGARFHAWSLKTPYCTRIAKRLQKAHQPKTILFVLQTQSCNLTVERRGQETHSNSGYWIVIQVSTGNTIGIFDTCQAECKQQANRPVKMEFGATQKHPGFVNFLKLPLNMSIIACLVTIPF